ncbi:HNH endonuclease [Bacteroides finegoldii]|jgi:5-methylcytosine-specific restriction protein A|uniref:HNH endonuclease n=1 Tax=Bacteroides finegoldii TaxID=338188 RepID=UPI00242E11DE|nr:HNH endonuclease [Bacteroides finegoldii]
MCLKENKTTPAEDIHHIISFMSTDDPVQRAFLAYDYDNLMSLCKKCHQAAHNKL